MQFKKEDDSKTRELKINNTIFFSYRKKAVDGNIKSFHIKQPCRTPEHKGPLS